MFRAFIRPSSGVQVVTYCVWYSADGVIDVIPEEPARSLVHKTVSRLLGDYSNYTFC
jgi:hypothetical protein